MRTLFHALVWGTLAVALPVWADPCASEDYETWVNGQEQCLVMRRYGDEHPETMVVWLHGDVSSGGPANYHFPLAQNALSELAGRKVLSIALVRPGYPDGEGRESGVAFMNTGRRDHYTRTNISEVGAAIERLRARYSPARVIVVGHSGGAATAAVLLGMKPGLIDTGVLVACPCELDFWRRSRGGRHWGGSENPLRWTGSIPPQTRVIALTGDNDVNTRPDLAIDYIEAVQRRGIRGEFRMLAGETHNGAIRSTEIAALLRELTADR